MSSVGLGIDKKNGIDKKKKLWTRQRIRPVVTVLVSSVH